MLDRWISTEMTLNWSDEVVNIRFYKKQNFLVKTPLDARFCIITGFLDIISLHR